MRFCSEAYSEIVNISLWLKFNLVKFSKKAIFLEIILSLLKLNLKDISYFKKVIAWKIVVN